MRGEMRIRNGPSGGVGWGRQPITVSLRAPEVGSGFVSSQTVPISPKALIRPCEMSISLDRSKP